MKNVIKSSNRRFSEPSKTSFPGHLKRLIPAAALCLTLIAVPLTGCFEPKPQQTIYKETSGTTYIMINEVILATGHAKPVYIKPNLRYADTFRLYETDD